MKYLAIILFMVISCGDETVYTKYPDQPQPTDDGDNDKTFPADVKAAINRNCISCHGNDAFPKDPELFRKKGAPRVANGSMPPGGGISEKDKALLINF